MAAYQAFTAVRTTDPDPATLFVQLRALDPTVGVQHQGGFGFILKKATAWTAPQITAAQTVLNTAPAATLQLTAQSTVDSWPLDLKAAFLLVMEQMNVVRAALPSPLPPFTVAQFLSAIKAKALTL